MRWGGASRGPKGQGWSEKVFPVIQGGDGARQNHIRRERRPHPLTSPRSIAIPNSHQVMLRPKGKDIGTSTFKILDPSQVRPKLPNV